MWVSILGGSVIEYIRNGRMLSSIPFSSLIVVIKYYGVAVTSLNHVRISQHKSRAKLFFY